MDDGIEFPGYAPAPVVQPLARLRFDDRAGAWVAEPEAQPQDWPARRLRLVTFNTWFQGPEPAQRHAGLLAELARADADLILLQEATVPLVQALEATDWVRRGYCYSRAPFRAAAIPSHGLALFARAAFGAATLHPIPTRMGRALLTVQLAVDGQPLRLATVHLESMKQHADTRAQQLRHVFELLDADPDVMLAGDFNLAPDAPENALLDRRYLDCWPAVHPADPGYTQDTGRNAMLARAKGEQRRQRIDRVLLRSDTGRWRPVAMELLGTQPLPASHGRLYPSDHFGLLAVLERVAT